jgi:hypothetical protein
MTRHTDSPDGSGPTLSTAFAHERRRLVLRHLLRHDDGVDLDSLVDAIRAAERALDPGTDNSRQSIRISLHHSHLPLLDDARLVEYDRSDGHVSPTIDSDSDEGRSTALRRLLAAFDEASLFDRHSAEPVHVGRND